MYLLTRYKKVQLCD